MSFSLKNAFFGNARGLTFADGGGITWSFNQNTNSISGTASASGTVTSIGSTTLTIGGTASVPTVNLSSTQLANIAAGGTALQTASVIDSITGAGTAGSPLQLSGDAATPGNSFYYGTNSSGTKGWYASIASAAASATIGLSAVVGTGTAYMLANAAPALSQAITPTWTNTHTFSTATVSISAAGQINTSASLSAGTRVTAMLSGDASVARSTTTGALYFGSNGTQYLYYDGSYMNLGVSGFKTPGPCGFNGATPPSQVTGWGTPTGPAVVNNFSGTAATLVQCSNAIAKIITDLKALGFYGA